MLEEKQVDGAVDAILALLKAKNESVTLTDQPKKIDLQIALKKIPKLNHKTIPIYLPASLHYELREVCVFVKDLDQKTREYEVTVQHYKDLFSKHNVETVSKIVPIKALRTDYSLPLSKKSLAKAYDLYLADGCIIGFLPALLGKTFYAKKKTVPVKVNLGAKNLKKEMEKAINKTNFVIDGSGSSCAVTVAHDRMDKEQIVSNILVTCKRLAEKVPGGQNNIRNIYVKSVDTMAVPLYMNAESANDVKLPKVKRERIPTYIGEVTTVKNGLVKISADGRVKIIKDKGKKGKKEDGKFGQQTDEKNEKIDDTKKEPEDANSDNDNKEDVKVEKRESKRSGKPGKKRKKKDASIDDRAVEKDVESAEEVEETNDVEMIGSESDNKEDVQVEIREKKRRRKGGKKQKKRKSEENVVADEDMPVVKKKVKTEIISP